MSPYLRRRSQTVHTKNAPTTVPPSPRKNTSVVWGIPVTQEWSPRERAGQELSLDFGSRATIAGDMSLKMIIVSLIGGGFALTANLVAQAWVDSHPLLFVVLNISFGYVIVSIVISYVGGWASLARKFRFRGQFHGSRWRGQSGLMRWIAGYHNCLTVGANENGLYLAGFPFLLLGHPPLLIPWNEVSHAKRMTLFSSMVRFELGRETAIPFFVRETLAERLRNVAGKAWPVGP